MGFIADGLAREHFPQAYRSRDITGADLLDVLTLVGVHLQQSADALATALGGVVDARARSQHAGVDADEGEGTHEGIGHDLEDEGREGLLVFRLALHFVAIGIDALDGRDVQGRRHVAHHRVEHGLDALVLEGGATHHRREGQRDAALADAGADLVLGQRLAAKVLVHQRFVGLGDHLDHLLAPFLGALHQLRGDVAVDDLETLVGFVERDGLHGHEIHHAAEMLFRADGDLDGHGARLEARLHHLDHAEEIRAGTVHLVDEGHAGHAVLVGLAPHGLGLGLDAAHRTEDGASAIQHAQAAFHLGREVHVAGGVDDVDAMLDSLQLTRLGHPGSGDGRRGDGDAPLLLLHHPVGGGSALVYLTDLVDLAGVVEDALRRGRLAGIDVRHDADVPVALEGSLAGHCGLLERFSTEKSRDASKTFTDRAAAPAALSGLRNCYQRKCAKALLASAILWTSSFFLIAAPRKFMASRISPASLSRMVRSPREAE